MTLRQIMGSSDLLPATEAVLRQAAERRDQPLPDWYWFHLASAKKHAVAAGDQDTAKAIWCLETIGQVQDAFIRAFNFLREDAFKLAWDSLERAEIELGFLERHFPDDENEFGIQHIGAHVPRLQSIFPYKWGFSPAFVHKRMTCSICSAPISLRSPCGHTVGEIYDGEMCARRMEDMVLLHVALVDNPVQKYSVVELEHTHPGFDVVRYVVRGLHSPWDWWAYKREERREHHPVFKDVGRNAPCPCASGKKYKRCCLRSETVFPHFSIQFERDPPPEMQRLVVRPPGPSP